MAQNKPKTMLKTRTYLEPNRNSLQKPIGGLSRTTLPELYKAPLNKGAIDKTEHNSPQPERAYFWKT